jgi:hypothetical protein
MPLISFAFKPVRVLGFVSYYSRYFDWDSHAGARLCPFECSSCIVSTLNSSRLINKLPAYMESTLHLSGGNRRAIAEKVVCPVAQEMLSAWWLIRRLTPIPTFSASQALEVTSPGYTWCAEIKTLELRST